MPSTGLVQRLPKLRASSDGRSAVTEAPDAADLDVAVRKLDLEVSLYSPHQPSCTLPARLRMTMYVPATEKEEHIRALAVVPGGWSHFWGLG